MPAVMVYLTDKARSKVSLNLERCEQLRTNSQLQGELSELCFYPCHCRQVLMTFTHSASVDSPIANPKINAPFQNRPKGRGVLHGIPLDCGRSEKRQKNIKMQEELNKYT